MEDGQTSDSRMGSKYQWEPNPIMAVTVCVITVIIVLIPAVCSVCYHVHMKSHRGKVRVFFTNIARGKVIDLSLSCKQN